MGPSIVSPRIAPVASNVSGSEEAKLRKISQDFEAIFLNFMLKGMRQTVTESGGLPKAAGHDLYQQLFNEEISKSLARSRGAGIGEMIYRELTRQRPVTVRPKQVEPPAEKLPSEVRGHQP